MDNIYTQPSTTVTASLIDEMELKMSRYLVISEPTDNGEYCAVYSRRSTNTLLLPSPIVAQLRAGNYLDIDEEVINELVTNEMLIPEEEDEMDLITSNGEIAEGDDQSLYYVVAPKASCEMGCSQCNKKRSSEDFYQNILERIEEKLFTNDEYKRLDIAWLGAEPLLSYAHIEKLSPMLIDLAQRYQCTYAATMVTDGLRLEKDIFKNLAKLGFKRIEVALERIAEYSERQSHLQDDGNAIDRVFENVKKILMLPHFEQYGVKVSIRCNTNTLV